MAVTVDLRVPYANAGAVEVRPGPSAGETTVAFTAAPHGGPEALWFCLRLRAARGQRVGRLRLVLKHVYNLLGAGDPRRLWPVWRPARGDWERLPAGTPEHTPDGQGQAVWSLDVPAAFADVALCYPYGMPEVEALARETGGYWHADEIGLSQAGRPLVRLSNRYAAEKDPRPGFYFVARQHSGETPGSWVLDGLLRRLAALGDAAPTVWAVPLSNIDGVEGGDYGKDNFPYDLNRAWGQPPMRHETLVIQRDLRRWQGRCRPFVAMDFHAPGACENNGIYGFLPKADVYPAQYPVVARVAAAIRDALGPTYAADEFLRSVNYRSRWETPTFTSGLCAMGIPALTFENPYGMARAVVFTREAYRDAGARMADALIALAAQPEPLPPTAPTATANSTTT